jgi:chemotaxis protein methyltransferase CheR
MNAMSDHEFNLYRKLVYDRAGIALNPSKKALLEARLGRRVRQLGMESFRAYYEYVTADRTGGEMVCLLDRVATNATHFFREPRQFQFVAQKLLPGWITQAHNGERPARVRTWSAGCSTGEEPYSLAMLLLDFLSPIAGWEVEIIGTDLSSRALESAKKAIWSIEKAKEIPEEYLKRYMLKGTGSQSGLMKAGPQLRSMVHFQHLNLNDGHSAIAGLFDLIFCRNVLIYFDAESRSRVIQTIIKHLGMPGYLFVGHAESLAGLSEQLQHVIPTVYRHVAETDVIGQALSGAELTRTAAHGCQ